jgi:hypothetical protein
VQLVVRSREHPGLHQGRSERVCRSESAQSGAKWREVKALNGCPRASGPGSRALRGARGVCAGPRVHQVVRSGARLRPSTALPERLGLDQGRSGRVCRSQSAPSGAKWCEVKTLNGCPRASGPGSMALRGARGVCAGPTVHQVVPSGARLRPSTAVPELLGLDQGRSGRVCRSQSAPSGAKWCEINALSGCPRASGPGSRALGACVPVPECTKWCQVVRS